MSDSPKRVIGRTPPPKSASPNRPAQFRRPTEEPDAEFSTPRSERAQVAQRRKSEAIGRVKSRPKHRKRDLPRQKHPQGKSVRFFRGMKSRPKHLKRDLQRQKHPQGKSGPQTRRRSDRIRLTVARIGVAIFAVLIAVALWQREDPVQPPEGLESNEVIAEQSPPIPPSQAVEMFIPAIDVHAEFQDGSCRVKDGAINPETMDKACTYTAGDRPYSLPGTNSPDIVVIAGHTGAGVPAVFNNLYDGSADHHRVQVGDKLYVRTADSGDNWLVYTATDLHDPMKEGLSEDSSIWGEGASPGRLLTISCIQPANPLQSSIRNAVVGWQFQGTSNTANKSDSKDS